MTSAGPAAARLREMIAEGPVILSGGLGTELQRRGCSTMLPLWAATALLEAPDAVRTLHADYVRAGAQIVTANTFRTDPRTITLAQPGIAHTTLTRRAVELARQGIEEAAPGHDVLVAGSAGPVRDCYRPDEVPDEGLLREEHDARVTALVDAGADLLFVETMNTIREAVTVLDLARDRLPACVAFVCAPGGRLLSGEMIAEAAAAVEAWSPEAILVNCCTPAVATEALVALVDATDRPVGVYANGEGCPEAPAGWRFEGGASDDDYVAEAARWFELGISLVGGCCGTSPTTVRRLVELGVR